MFTKNLFTKILLIFSLFFIFSCNSEKIEGKTVENIKFENIKKENISFLKKTVFADSEQKKIEKLKIDFISPKEKIKDLTKNITVRFNQPVIAFTSLDNQEKCPIKFVPELKGKCIWITTSTFQFRPESGFAIGAKYKITVGEDFKTINKQKLEKTESFEIETPKFEVLNVEEKIKNSEKIKIIFNSPVDLEEVKKNLEIKNFTKKEDLKLEYQKNKNELGVFKEQKNVVLVSNSKNDWGYEKEYDLVLEKGLKNIRGNMGFEKKFLKKIKTNSFLEHYSELILKDKTKDFSVNNIYYLKDEKIITTNNPIIGFSFSDTFPKNKELIEIISDGKKIDFDFHTPRGYEKFTREQIKRQVKTLEDSSEFLTQEEKSKKIRYIKNLDKRGMLIKLNKVLRENSSLIIKLKTSQISSNKDLVLNFNTSKKNKVADFKFIDYKLSCLYLEKDLYSGSYYVRGEKKLENFEFLDEQNNKAGKIISFNEIYNNNNDENEKDCTYKQGLFGYKLNTLVTPEKQIKLKVKKELIDNNVYPLDKDYIFSFETGKIKNRDKSLNISSNGDFRIFSKNSKEFPLLISTININKVEIEVCNSSFDILSDFFIGNEKNCHKKIIDVRNNGFENSNTIINLKNIFGKEFDRQAVYVKVSKIIQDSFVKATSKNNPYYYYNNPNYFETNFLINSVNAIIKNGLSKQSLWFISLKNGKSLKASDIEKIVTFNKRYDSNAKKYFYKKYGEVSFKEGKDGLVETIGKSTGNHFLVTLKTGEKILINNPGDSTSIPEKIFIFTDKPIYKPSDTIHIKGFVRNDKSEKLELSKNKSVRLEIRDSRHTEILKDKDIILNKNGGFEYDLVLKNNASLGQYTLKINDQRYNFSVQKYEKPDFKINLKSDKKVYAVGEKAKINVLGEYYLGTGLANGIGGYTIFTKKYHFKPKDFSNYLWGENKNYFYKSFFYNPIVENFKFLRGKQFILNNFGKKDLEIDLESNENKIFKIDVNLKDPKTKKTVSKNVELTVLNSNVFAGMKFNKGYFSYNDNLKIDFISVDKDGKKIKDVDLEFSVKKKEFIYNKDSGKNEIKEEKLLEKKLTTDKNGVSQINYEIKDFGEITFEIKAKNNNFKTTKTFYIYGNDKIKKEENAGKLNIIPEKQEYKIGEKAKINIFSDLKGKAIITIEKQNKVFETKIVDVEKSPFVYELEVKKEYLPNFYVSAILLGTDSTKYESGEIILRVNKQNIKLNTKVLTDKKEYLPGDKQVIELEIKDFEGKNINGEATIAIVDESLLALKKRSSKNIIDYFYDKKSNNIRTNNLLDLFVRKVKKDDLKKNVIENEYKKESFRGGDILMTAKSMDMGMALNAMPVSESLAGNSAPVSPNSTKIRTDFKDIAHFFGTIKVKNGKAKVVVDKLPDNLTTWIIDGFVITKDTKVGTIKKSFKVKKDLSIIPSLPRFFMLNDEFEIKTVVINNSDKDLEINPILEISNAKILEKAKNITVAKKSQKVVKWKVKISHPSILPLSGEGSMKESEIKITIKSGKLVDSVILKRKIKAYSTPETVFTNGKTEKISYEEKIFLKKNIDKNFGNLRISIGTNILANLMGKIEDLIPKNIWFNSYYSIETLDKIASIMNLYKIIGEEEKLKEIKIYEEKTKKYYSLDEVVKKSLEELKYYVNYNGGIQYSKSCHSNYCTNFRLSVKTLKILNEFKKLDYEIENKDIEEKLKKYIKKEITKQTFQQPSPFRGKGVAPKKIKNIESLIILALSGEEKFVLGILDKVEFGDSNIDKLNKIKLYRILKIKKDEIKKILESLKNNVLIEARGTIIKSENYTNDISTALGLIEFLENGETEKLLTENFARFLISNHLGKNSFGKSIIIDSLAKYVEKTGELKGVDFVGKGYLDYRKIIEKKFDENNKFEIHTKNFPIKDYIELGKDNPLGFKKDGKGMLYYDVNLTYFLPIEEIKPRDEGLIISRKYYKMEDYLKAYKKECHFWRYYADVDNCYYRKIKEIEEVKTAKTGEILVGEIELITPRERSNVVIENFIPAGVEIMNSSLDVTPEIVKQITGKQGGYYGFSSIENYEDKVFMFAPKLYSGSYKYTYVIKINHAGKFHNKPAIGYLLDKPEIWGRTGGEFFEVGE